MHKLQTPEEYRVQAEVCVRQSEHAKNPNIK